MPVQGIWRHYRLLLFSQLLCVCGQHFGRQGVPLAAVNDTPVSSSAGAADVSCQLSVLCVNVGFGLLVLGWWSGRQEFSGWVVSDFARQMVEY